MSARRRIFGAVLCAAAVLAVALPLPASASGCSFAPNHWVSLVPHFPEGGANVVSTAVLGYDPDDLFVANDRSLLRSADGGCSFQTAFTLNGAGFGGDVRVVQVTMDPQDPTRVYAVLEDDTGTPRPRILRSRDGGATWHKAETGLQAATGRPLDLSVFRDHGPIYLLVSPTEAGQGDTVVATRPTIYMSNNEGDYWEARFRAKDLATFSPLLPPAVRDLHRLKVDPFDPNELWVWGPDGLFVSRDGGVHLTRLEDRPISDVDVVRSYTSIAHVLAFDAELPQAFVSTNDGGSFTTAGLPAAVQTSAPGRDGFEVIMATVLGHVLHLDPYGFSDISPSRAVIGLSSARLGTELVVFARTATTVERLVLPGGASGGNPHIKPLPDIELPGHRPLKTPTLLTPGHVLVAPGGTRTLPAHLFLPGTRKVDVFFLVDASGSMGDVISGLRAALYTIVTDLQKANIDVNFGIGEYRGYEYAPAYRRLLDIHPYGQLLKNRLGLLAAAGGANETSLEALYEVALGRGRPGAYEPLIAPHKQANWRPGSLRVIVHATDEAFGNPSPSATAAEAAAALNDVHALQVGLAFEKSGTQVNKNLTDRHVLVPKPSPDLIDMARRTGALAPQVGADCNGDGAREISPNDPLVCIIDPARAEEASVMAPAIVNLLLAAKDIGNVTLRSDGPPGLVRRIDPAVVRNIDFRERQQLGYAVTFACPEGSLGKTFDVGLRAVTRDSATLASATTTVVCGTLPREIPVLPLAIVLQPFPAPQPVPQANPGPQPQANAQGAFAAQKQEQVQLAYGYVNPNPEPGVAPARASSEEQYSMSRYDRGTGDAVPPGATMLAGAAFAVGFVMVNRRRTRTAPATVRATIRPRRRFR